MSPANKLDTLAVRIQTEAEKSTASNHSFYLNDDLVKRFKDACNQRGIKTSPAINALLEEALREQE